MALDAFAPRYAASRELAYAPAGENPPATWFLESVALDRSHSFLRGPLAGGPQGTLFYVDRPVPTRRRQMTGWTVALYVLPDAARLAYGIACAFRPGPVWGGRVQLPVTVPPGLTETPVHEPTLDERYLVAVSEGELAAVPRVFSDDFAGWLAGLPWQKTGAEVPRFELRNGTLCVYTKPKLRTARGLDVFCERAARVATQVIEAAGER
jgi:hypothetical protein